MTEKAAAAATRTKVWVFRKKNGQWRVHPSPVHLQAGETFTIRNLTDTQAEVSFAPRTIQLANPGDPKGRTIPARDTSADLVVVAAGPTYFEYDVTLPSDEYAEGGSRPGAIIDP